jgi:hypothetical protein
MSRTLKRLATAAAATSALALIPLAATAAPAATATARSQAGGLGTSANWGGYVLHANQGQRFRGVQAAFTVPVMSCGNVLRTHGSNPHYGNAAFWAGLGGWKGQPLEQGGVEAQCLTNHGQPELTAFTEMVPGLQPSPDWLPLDQDINSVTQDHGTPKPIHSGDHVYVWVEDQAAAWSDRGHTYDVFVFDETTGMYNSRDYSIPSQTGTDQTAEIITEAAGDGPSGNNHVGFINTGTVHYDTANALTWFHGSGVPPQGHVYLGINSNSQWRADMVSLSFTAPGRWGERVFWVVQPGFLYGYTPPSPKESEGAGKHEFDTYWVLPSWLH